MNRTSTLAAPSPTVIAILFIALGFGLSFCQSPQHSSSANTMGDLWNERISESFDTAKLLKINYVTTRRKKNEASTLCDQQSFGSLTDVKMHYGTCTISAPAKRNVGEIPFENPVDKTVSFQLIQRNEEEESNFWDRIKANPFPEVIVFVHGFNVNFDEAAVRASQIKFDLKFPGEVIVYSWPAGTNDSSVLGKLMVNSVYDKNFEEAQINRQIFESFLKFLNPTEKKVHLIVHSMGHQVVLPALAALERKGKESWIQELILNAPDFDRVEFSQISPSLLKISKRVTLYCSPGDNALIASQKVNGGPRAGMCFKFPGMDVINVNEVDSPALGVGGLGHGYYSSRPILTDIFQVILGVKAEKRLFLRKSGPNNGEDFVLRR